MENAVIYARYSSTNQTENSIEAQVAAATEYAKNHKYNIVKTYADRAKTGTNDNRESFQQMLSDTDKKFFTVIIVWKVDRFGRNREEIALNKYRCKKNGVRVEYVAENITSGPEGIILESVLEGFAEYYSRQLSQNTRRGLKNVVLKGEYSGGRPPLGYKIVNKHYVIEPEGAKKIKQVFKMFTTGYSYAEIARTLDLKEYNIRWYLTNELYYSGELVRGDVRVANVFEPIIDEETFKLANIMLGNHVKYRKPLDYLLSGKIYCSECGKRFVGFSCSSKYNKKYAYYRCKCKCSGHSVNVKVLPIEEDVLTKAKNILLSDDAIESLTSAVYEKLKQRVKILNGTDKSDVLKRKQNIIDAIEKGIISLDDASDRLSKLNEELSKTAIPLISKDEVKNFILEMKNLKEDRALINCFVDRIEVDPFTKKYTIRFCPNQFSLK